MKNHPTPRSAFAALAPAALLMAVPGHAQELQPTTPPAVEPVQTVTPPPVVPTVTTPPAATVAPTVTPPAATVAPPEVAPTVTETPEAAPAPRTTNRTATRTVTRSTRAERTSAPAPVRAAPVAAAPVAAAPAPAPAEVTPAPVTPAPVEATTPPPVAEAATQTTTAVENGSIWPFLITGLVALLAVIGFVAFRRRRVEQEDEDLYYEEPYSEAAVAETAPIRSEPTPFAPDPEPQFLRTAPLVAASDTPTPVAAEEATLVEPEAEDVASLTQADAPVADRPWLEMSLRPVRAGTNVDEALVEIELTVGNSGSVAARDVRISTFLFASEPADGSEMERLLIERGDESVPPVTIEPGEGTRVDATLGLSKASLIESTNGAILPIVVADARYTLPDGSEGRTSASFTIGVSEEGTPAMSPIQLGERAMHDEVEARLHGVPEHA